MSDNILKDMAKKQIKNIHLSKRLQFTDLKRIAKNLTSTIFDQNDCSLWTGYITNINNESKGVYINFYFRGKKIALHRLLYINFIGNLDDDEYIKFSCPNKGKCCNLNHLIKYKYVNNKQKNKDSDDKNSHVDQNNDQDSDNIFIVNF